MNISKCPRCNDTIRVPDVPAHVYQARCPWCGETFPLAEVFNQLPPVLTILGADGNAVGAVPTESLVAHDAVAPTPDDGSDLQQDLAGFVLNEGQPAGNDPVAFADQSFDQASGRRGSIAPSVNTTRRRKSGGGLRSLLGIVFGGLLAVPIAGGILWGLNLGPFADSAGAKTRVAAPPRELRAERRPSGNPQLTVAEPAAGNQQDRDDPNVIVPAADPAMSSAPQSADPTLQDPGDDDRSDAVANSTDLESSTDLTVADAGDSETGDDPSNDLASLPDSNQPGASPPESKQLRDTVDRAQQMINALETYDVDKSKRVQWLVTAYETIAKAGELATADGPAIQQLAQTIKRSKILEELDQAGVDWMDFENRGNGGVLIIGTYDGDSLTLTSGRTVNLSGAAAESATGRVIVLGRIVDAGTVEAVVMESIP